MTDVYRRDGMTIHPPSLFPDYESTIKRAPKKPLIIIPQTLTEITGPVYGDDSVKIEEADLTRQHAGEPLGERIIVHGRVLDESGQPVPNTLIEIWQANAGGKYRHVNDNYLAAADPNFHGCGRTLSDADGWYRFRTIKPGPYPWRNRINDWRPAHIHYSIFGHSFVTRLITQLYFEGDPLLRHCPIYHSIPDVGARERLVATLDLDETIPLDTIAYRFDIVLRGRRQTPFENKLQGN